MTFVNTKPIKQDKMSLFTRTGPHRVPPGPHPETPVFSLKFILFQLHRCPGAHIYCRLLPKLAPGGRSKRWVYLTPRSLTLMWIKVWVIFPRGICVWRFWFGEEITRELLETWVLFPALLLTNLDSRLASLGLCFLHSKTGVLSEISDFQTFCSYTKKYVLKHYPVCIYWYIHRLSEKLTVRSLTGNKTLLYSLKRKCWLWPINWFHYLLMLERH